MSLPKVKFQQTVQNSANGNMTICPSIISVHPTGISPNLPGHFAQARVVVVA